MSNLPRSVLSTVSSVHSLGKTAWRIGTSLQQLDQNAQIFDVPVKNLNDETRALGADCDHLYAELDRVVRKSETGSLEHDDVHAKVWTCLASQVEDIGCTLHELEQFIRGIRVEGNSYIVQFRRPSTQNSGRDLLGNIRENLSRLSQSLRITLLLVQT